MTAEADKLLAYAHGREITEEDVEQLCSKTIERSAFDLAAALVEGRAKDAFTMLEELFALQQKPVMIHLKNKRLPLHYPEQIRSRNRIKLILQIRLKRFFSSLLPTAFKRALTT